MGHVRAVTAGLVVAGVVGLAPPPAAAVTPCSKGNVALTFDDGPRAPYTTRILDTLKVKRAPATFFVVGRVADAQPALLKRMYHEGHRVGNHSWSHPKLSSLSDSGIRSELSRTNQEIRSQGLPTPTMMRPPYRATSSRVRSVVASMGMAHVEWTVDTSDWRPGRSASAIVGSALSQLHPGANILMHDGVGNSGTTATALPSIINGARARGYCIGTLDDAGRVVSATPRIRIASARVLEPDQGTTRKLSFSVSLSVPTSRKVNVDWKTIEGSARAGRDYRHQSGSVAFAPGATTARVVVPVIGDDIDEYSERFQVQLTDPVAARIGRGTARGTIVDDDAPARIRVGDSRAAETAAAAKVRVRLNRPSGKRISVAYTTVNGSAKAGRHYVATTGSLVFRPGQTTKTIGVPLIDRKLVAEGTTSFAVSLRPPVNATLGRSPGVVSIVDDPLPLLSTASATVVEADGHAEVDVKLSRATARTVTVAFATVDGTAHSGHDYARVSRTLTFSPGQTAKRVSVPVIDNQEYTSDRRFDVRLSRIDGRPLNAVFGAGLAAVDIVEDDPQPEPEPEGGE